MNKSIIKLFLLGGLAITSITSCTDNYMDYNKNPYEVTDDEMERDAHKLGAALVGMQSVIVPVGEHLAQFSECLLGGVFVCGRAGVGSPEGGRTSLYRLRRGGV